MIVVTGAAGFIGSNIVAGLNRRNYRDIVMVDAFNRPEKIRNYESKIYTALVERSEFMEWLERNNRFVQMIIHMGARTDTTEFNQDVFRKLNLDYSKMIFRADQLVSFISRVMTLEKDDIILTGTPPGVGEMKVGDLVEVEIEGIGRLKNRVVAA